MSQKVVFLVGSLRNDSISGKITDEVRALFPDSIETEVLDLRDLPLYDADYDNPEVSDKPLPDTYTPFRQAIKEADGVFFVTPENNRTIPAVLKNAIDVGSKPTGDAAWTKKPAGIISHSVGRLGGFSAQKNLQLALGYFQMPIVTEFEVFLSQSPQYFDEDGKMIQDTRDFLQSYVDRYVDLLK